MRNTCSIHWVRRGPVPLGLRPRPRASIAGGAGFSGSAPVCGAGSGRGAGRSRCRGGVSPRLGASGPSRQYPAVAPRPAGTPLPVPAPHASGRLRSTVGACRGAGTRRSVPAGRARTTEHHRDPEHRASRGDTPAGHRPTPPAPPALEARGLGQSPRTPAEAQPQPNRRPGAEPQNTSRSHPTGVSAPGGRFHPPPPRFRPPCPGSRPPGRRGCRGTGPRSPPACRR